MNSRREFEHNAFLLVERIRTGKMSFSADIKQAKKSLLNIRELPNSRIDLHSIDEFARMSMNMAANLEYRFKPKEDDDNTEQ